MKLFKFLLVCVASAGLFTQAANAQVKLTLTPVASNTVSIGNSIDYILSISGLQGYDAITDYGSVIYSQNGPGLSAFNITLNFDPSLVSFSVSSFLSSFGSGVADGISSGSDTSIAGQLNLNALSLDFNRQDFIGLDATGLPINQASSFTLATITATAIGEGTGNINIDTDSSSLSDQDGNTITLNSADNGSFEAVPEPSTTALLGLAGVAVLLKFRRRFAHAA